MDIIRIFACLCVLIIHFNASVSGYDIFGTFHYPNHLIPNNYFEVYLGAIGVGLFFILSSAGLQYANDTIYLNFSNLVTFFKKRFLSLYPAYWLTFSIYTLFFFLYNSGIPKIKLGYFLASIAGFDAYLGTLSHNPKYFAMYQCGEWFLGCIILLYLIYPLLSNLFNKFPKITTTMSFLLFFILSYHIANICFFKIPKLHICYLVAILVCGERK